MLRNTRILSRKSVALSVHLKAPAQEHCSAKCDAFTWWHPAPEHTLGYPKGYRCFLEAGLPVSSARPDRVTDWKWFQISYPSPSSLLPPFRVQIWTSSKTDDAMVYLATFGADKILEMEKTFTLTNNLEQSIFNPWTIVRLTTLRYHTPPIMF